MSSTTPPSMATSSSPSGPQSQEKSNTIGGTTTASAGGHHEDRLGRTWRTMESTLVVASQKAEKAASDSSKAALKELDDSVVTFLRTKVEWSRLVSYLEAKLEGKAKEIDTLQHYHRTIPKFESRKRKRDQEAIEAAVKPEAGSL